MLWRLGLQAIAFVQQMYFEVYKSLHNFLNQMVHRPLRFPVCLLDLDFQTMNFVNF